MKSGSSSSRKSHHGRKHREQIARRSREVSAEVADIRQIANVANPKRRDACRLNLERFLQTYFPASTGLRPFSEDHKRAIGRIQRCIIEGGLFVNAFPRGFAKTTISENAAIWGALYGHRRFIPIFGAEANVAAGNIDSIKLELSENDLLAADFPEVCQAIRALEGKPQRCASQTHTVRDIPCKGKECKRFADGKWFGPTRDCAKCGGTGYYDLPSLTHIEWRADTIVFPTIPGSKASGCIITTRGITAASRGMKHKRPDGTQQRPDFVLIDDPQTDESAGTDLQVDKRLSTVQRSILKLAGHDRRLACVVNATVIRRGDMIEQLLNPKKFPAWQGERIRMVKSWSKVHDTLWLGDYARLRNTYEAGTLGDQQRAHREATAFYKRNRAAMDEGCSVSWEHCYDRDTEISAIQHAYNALIDDGPEVFASECQNEPLEPEIENAAEMLSAEKIAEKLNQLERGRVPATASRVVAFIDVQKTILYWMVCAFDDGFGGAVLDYGTWPDQHRSYFSSRDLPARQTIAAVTKAAGLEAQIYSALDTLTGELASREWQREDGANLKIERLGIDANWGESTDVIYQFCRQSPQAAILVPSHGKYVGAASRPFREYAKKPGDRVGLNWRMPTPNKRSIRYLLFDTNFWKSFTHSRLSTAMGGAGCLTLFGGESQEHKLLADHLTAEYGVTVQAKGKSLIEWQLKPTRPDNHYLDTLVGAHVLGSMQGVKLAESQSSAAIAVKKVKFSELQKNGTW